MNFRQRVVPGQRDLLALAAAFPQRYPCLLQSVLRGTAQSRYDILFALPRERIELHADGVLESPAGLAPGGRFLDALDSAWKSERTAADDDDDLPFRGGWVLMLAYELAGEIEPRLKLGPPADVPLALALRCPAAIIVDHQKKQTVLIAEVDVDDGLDLLQADLEVDYPLHAPGLPDACEEDLPTQFLAGVERIHQYLRAGDVFQVNLSRGWRASYTQPPEPAALYEALRRANPAPFAALLQQPAWSIVSSSPERLVQVSRGVAQVRPIAGTRPRLPGDNERERIDELSSHPKERAEHVMLIDLERNDLGKVCVPGTVEVDELMVVESYTHVHHMVSNVKGRLRPEVTPGELIAAIFPGGTITGCPKVRCMEIIAELEQATRGAYTGAIGYLGLRGELDLNILIRTLTVAGNQLSLRAGAGIVADSVPELELDETRAKARGLLRALGIPG